MEFAQPTPNMARPPPNLSTQAPKLSMPPPNVMGQGYNQGNKPPFRPFMNMQRPLPGPLGNMTLEDFDGKRLRKSVMRKTVDYNSSIIKALEIQELTKVVAIVRSEREEDSRTLNVDGLVNWN